MPLTYYYLFRNQPDVFPWGIALCGFMVVAQFSYFGEYLPKVFPLHLRGTGGSFATNVGGRMIGTCLVFVTTALIPMFASAHSDKLPHVHIAYAAACVAALTYGIGFLASFFLPEPPQEELAD